MRISDIIHLAKSYLLLGVLGAALAIILFIIGYFVIYRRFMKGTKRLDRWKMALWAISIVYLIVVMSATFVSRGNHFTGSINLHLFRSYREAWNSFSGYEWRSLILNILLFVPFGFLLPLLTEKCRKWWVTYLAGFFFSLLIETIQLLTKSGIADIDDVLNNTIGVTIGFGLVCIFFRYMHIKKSKVNQAEIKTCSIICFQIPLLVTLMAFAAIFSFYHVQELGNLGEVYSYRINMEKVHVTTELDFNDEQRTAYVYQTVVGSVDDAADVANRILAAVGTHADVSNNNIYEDTAVFRSEDGQYSVWVNFVGLTTWYIDHTQQNRQGKDGLSFVEIGELLSDFHVDFPENVEFTDNGNGRYLINAGTAEIGDHFLNGLFECTVVDDKTISTFNNEMTAYEKYKEFSIISEKEAYKKILDGKFQMYFPAGIQDFTVIGVALSYKNDSKGFFQPVYEFRVKIAGNPNSECSMIIPAIN